jgi:hypothetical protein
MRPTDVTKKHVIATHIRPARQRGEESIRLKVGSVQKELGWTNRTPSVFSTLSSKEFEREAGVELVEKRGGPPSGGPSTSVEFIYRVLDPPGSSGASAKPSSAGDALIGLYGIGAQVFKQLGGGEEYLRREREALRFPAEEYPQTGARETA